MTLMHRCRAVLVGLIVGLLVWFALFLLNYGILHELLGEKPSGVLGRVTRLLPGQSPRDSTAFPVVLLSCAAIAYWRAGGPADAGRRDLSASPADAPRPEASARFDEIVDQGSRRREQR